MLTAAITDSSLRSRRATPFDSAAPSDSRVETTISMAAPPTPPEPPADEQRQAHDDERLDEDRHQWRDAAEHDRAAAGRRHQKAVHDAAVEVVDQAHAAPAAGEHGAHHDDARREEQT